MNIHTLVLVSFTVHDGEIKKMCKDRYRKDCTNEKKNKVKYDVHHLYYMYEVNGNESFYQLYDFQKQFSYKYKYKFSIIFYVYLFVL